MGAVTDSIATAFAKAAAAPLSDIASQLKRLNDNIERDMTHRNVPMPPTPEEIIAASRDAVSAETMMAGGDPEWQVAINEEERRIEADRLAAGGL